MIRVNLLGEQRDNTIWYLLQLTVFSVVLAATLLACVLHGQRVSGELERAENKKALLETQLAKLKKRTKAVDELEKKRKLLGEKLMTIAKLKSRKQGPVRVLNDLTVSTPERAWLQSITQKTEMLQLNGVGLDNQTVSLLMRNLQQSEFFDGAELIFTKQYMRDGVKLQEFSLSAKLSNLLAKKAAVPAVEGKEEKKDGKPPSNAGKNKEASL